MSLCCWEGPLCCSRSCAAESGGHSETRLAATGGREGAPGDKFLRSIAYDHELIKTVEIKLILSGPRRRGPRVRVALRGPFAAGQVCRRRTSLLPGMQRGAGRHRRQERRR